MVSLVIGDADNAGVTTEVAHGFGLHLQSKNGP